jgi:transcriptional regulator GlxA family with amidase domain
MTSHCDGAFILAKAGLLKDKVSTALPSDIDKMRGMFPSLAIKKTCYLCISQDTLLLLLAQNI